MTLTAFHCPQLLGQRICGVLMLGYSDAVELLFGAEAGGVAVPVVMVPGSDGVDESRGEPGGGDVVDPGA